MIQGAATGVSVLTSGNGTGLIVNGTGAGKAAIFTGGLGHVGGDVDGVLTSLTLHVGTAQNGSATNITLGPTASGLNDFYTTDVVYIIGGTGVGQARTISGYNGATRVAAVSTNWVTNPDGTSKYIVAPFGLSGGSVVIDPASIWNFSEGAEPTTPIPSTATMLQILQHLKRREFNKVTSTATALKVLRDDSLTTLETMARTFDNVTATKGKAT
jgi:hypothetical protein